jgi:hypothetical protein
MYFVLFMLLVIFLWRDVFLKEYYISKSFVHYEIVGILVILFFNFMKNYNNIGKVIIFATEIAKCSQKS